MAAPEARAPAPVATVTATAAVVAVLYFAREILVPIALAVLLSFILAPATERLRRLGAGRIPSVIAVVVVAFALLAVLGGLVSMQLYELARELPRYERNIHEKIGTLSAQPEGVIGRSMRMLSKLGSDFEKIGPRLPAEGPRPTPVEIRSPGRSPAEVLGSVLSLVLGPLSTAAIVAVFVIFFLLQREDLRDRLIRLIGAEQIHSTTAALDEAARRVGGYLRMQLVVNTAYGVPIGLGLWAIGVPNPLLWGLLAALLRFVPYVGPLVAAVMPVSLAFAVDPGWMMVAETVLLFGVLELFSNNVMEPWLYGSSTGISVVAIIVAAVFWTWLWGPIGLVLSTPLTTCLLVVSRHVPQLGFLNVLLGDEPPLGLETRFYHRLLAFDPRGAGRIADEVLASRTLVEFHDEIVLPALRLAEQDRHRGKLGEIHERFVLQHTREMIDELGENAARSDGAHGAGDAGIRRRPDGPTVLCVPARDDADAITAAILAQLLDAAGLAARALPASPHESLVAQVESLRPEAVCVCALPPFAVGPAAELASRVRERVPGTTSVVIGVWCGPEEAPRADRRLAHTGAAVAHTLSGALEELAQLTESTSTEWLPAPIPQNESERLEALRALDLLDTPPEEVLDRVTRELAQAFAVPVTLLSLIDGDRQFWKSLSGLPPDLAKARQSDRSTSLCGHVVADAAPLVVRDVRRDRRFAANPFLRERKIRFYAGVPLRTRSGLVVGSLCLIDFVPRTLGDHEVKLLQMTADAMMREIELRAAGRTRIEAAPAVVQPESRA